MSKSYRFNKEDKEKNLEKLFAKSKAKKAKAIRKEVREAKMFA